MFCQHGIGYFYRDRRPPPKCRFPLLPYEPPKTLVKITVYASREDSEQHDEKLRGYGLTLINNPPPRIYDFGGAGRMDELEDMEASEAPAVEGECSQQTQGRTPSYVLAV